MRTAPSSNRDLEFGRFAPFQELAAGASLLRVVEAYVGTDAFRLALRGYLQSHSHTSVTTNDLLAVLAAPPRQSLRPVLDALTSWSPPRLGFDLRCDGHPRVAVAPVSVAIPLCVAYDRDGKRDEACGTVSPHHTSIALTARRCPTWIVPDAGARGPYWVDWSVKLAATALDRAWPAMTNAEQRAMFGELSDPDQKLRAFMRLASTVPAGELRDEGTYVLDLADRIGPELRPHFDRWVSARYGALARSADLTPDRLDDSPHAQVAAAAVRLVASTVDPDLAGKARPIAAKFRTWRYYTLAQPILELAAATDPAVRTQLLDSLATNDSTRWDTIDALSTLPGIAGVIARDPHVLDRLDAADRRRLFAHVCDQASRDMIAGLITDEPAGRHFGVLAHIDACIAESKKLEPTLRAWLAPTATALPKARSGS